MMFGFALIPIVTAAGVATDYSRVSNARTKLQSGLDAGVISAAKSLTFYTNDEIRTQVQTFITANVTGDFLSGPTVTVLSTGANDVSVTADGCVKLIFASFFGSGEPCVQVRADVQRPTQNYLEIALVLDNSGSMGGSKIAAAKTAAKDFTENLFQGITDPEKIKISVVPFTLSVNAGAGMNPATDPNIDRNGQSSIHWENLLPTGASPPAGVTSRLSLYSQLGETWNGCFEVRPGTWGLTDASPIPGNGDSLFVPMFAPDEPGEKDATSVRRNTLNSRGGGQSFATPNSYLNDDGSQSINYSGNTENSATNAACTPISTAFNLPFGPPTASWQEKNWLARSSANICRYNLTGTAGGTSGRKSIAGTGGDNNGAGQGPNFMCNALPLQRLTTNKSDVINKINALKADGNTNILEGLMWGWRTVSPNAPYSDGRAYNWNGGPIRNRKFIILMTDGDNYWANQNNPNESIYSPFGFYRNNRIGAGITNASSATFAMNTATRQACTNAKIPKDINNNEAIQVITIGFSTPGQEISFDGLKLLEDCASTEGGKKLFYKATSASELSQVFSQIAKNIGQLKLTR